MTPDDLIYLQDIFDCLVRIEIYTASGQAAFLENPMIQDAVIRNFEVMGEATKRLSPEIRQANPDVPWRQIAGLRDVLIHDYGRVDILEIWGIVVNDLSLLKNTIENLLS